MTDEESDYDISKEAPTDSDGHPIHPERGHRICAATKSEKTTPTKHGRERDDFDYCLLAAGWGEDRDYGPCSKHPVTGPQWGPSNPSYTHGAFSKHFRRDLTESEREAFEDAKKRLENPEDAQAIAREVVAELFMKYKRSADPRFLREARSMADTFNIAPDESLTVNHQGLEGAFMENLRSAHGED